MPFGRISLQKLWAVRFLSRNCNKLEPETLPNGGPCFIVHRFSAVFAGQPSPSQKYCSFEPASSTSLSHKRTSNDTNQPFEQAWYLQLHGKTHYSTSVLTPDWCVHIHASILAEEPRNRSPWDLPFKLQSSVCFPDVARPNGSWILPLSHNYSCCNTHNEIARWKQQSRKPSWRLLLKPTNSASKFLVS